MSGIELTLALGLGVAALVPILAKANPRLASLAAGIFAALAFALGLSWFNTGTPEVIRNWIEPIGIHWSMRVDALGHLFWLLISGIGTLIVIYADSYMPREKLATLLSPLLCFMVAMLGLVSAGNAITLFVFWEATSITSFLLIGFKRDDPAARRSALQALAITGLGGLVLLAGLLIAGTENRSYEFNQWQGLSPVAFSLIAIGCMTKSAQFPFHFWLPNAMSAPTPISAYLHSATMVKAGVFLLAKLSPVMGQRVELVAIGATTFLLGSLLSLFEKDLKRILAWSTVAALGSMVMLIGAATHKLSEALTVTILAHACYKGALFMVAGAVDHAVGTRDVTLLRGLRKPLPGLMVGGLLAALSLIGLPPFLGFIGKELALAGFAHPAILGVLFVAGITNVVVATHVVFRPFFGKGTPSEVHHGPEFGLNFGPIVLGGLGLLFGLASAPLWPDFVGFLGSVGSAVAGEEGKSHIALWHGFGLPVILSGLILLCGAGLAMVSMKLVTLGTASETPRRFSMEGILLSGYRFFPKIGKGVTQLIERRSIRSHVVFTVSAFLALVGGLLAWQRFPIHVSGELLYLNEDVFLAAAIAASTSIFFIRSRMGAVTILGVVGVAVAMLFVTYSAPDLALTQILVDVLTVILFVLVFHSLPRFQNLSSHPSKARDAVLAALFGGTMALLLLGVLSEPMMAPLNQYFAQQSYPGARGLNVVNTIIVDFRGLDTMGEITVLCIAALGVHTLIRMKNQAPAEGGQTSTP